MNIEAEIIAHLNAVLSVGVYADVPKTRPVSFVTVERTGGNRDDYGIIDHPIIAVQSWAESRYGASQLAYAVDAAMHSMVGNGVVTSVETTTVYNFPSTDDIPRYQGVYQLTSHALD